MTCFYYLFVHPNRPSFDAKELFGSSYCCGEDNCCAKKNHFTQEEEIELNVKT